MHSYHHSPNDHIDSIRRHETKTEGNRGGPITLAHSLLKLLYDGSKKQTTSGLASPVKLEGALHSVLELVFDFSPANIGEKIRRKIVLLRKMLLNRWGARQTSNYITTL